MELLKPAFQELRKSNPNLQMPDWSDIEHETKKLHEEIKVVTKNCSKLKFVVLGEATQTWANYFYNPKAPTTSFLYPSYFNLKSKSDLIDCFSKSSVLVFDLHPFPLKSVFYSSITSPSASSGAYKTLIRNYYGDLTKCVDNDTMFVVRYKKLLKTSEFKTFKSLLSVRKSQLVDIYSTHMGPDKKKISAIFKGKLACL